MGQKICSYRYWCVNDDLNEKDLEQIEFTEEDSLKQREQLESLNQQLVEIQNEIATMVDEQGVPYAKYKARVQMLMSDLKTRRYLYDQTMTSWKRNNTYSTLMRAGQMLMQDPDRNKKIASVLTKIKEASGYKVSDSNKLNDISEDVRDNLEEVEVDSKSTDDLLSASLGNGEFSADDYKEFASWKHNISQPAPQVMKEPPTSTNIVVIPPPISSSSLGSESILNNNKKPHQNAMST